MPENEPRKYYGDEYSYTIEGVIDAPIKMRSPIPMFLQDAAVDAARNFAQEHGGSSADWPLNFILHIHKCQVARYRIDRVYTPLYLVSQLQCTEADMAPQEVSP